MVSPKKNRILTFSISHIVIYSEIFNQCPRKVVKREWQWFQKTFVLPDLDTICKWAVVEAPNLLVWSMEGRVCACLLHTTDTGQGRHLWSSQEVPHHTQGSDDCTGPWTLCLSVMIWEWIREIKKVARFASLIF